MANPPGVPAHYILQPDGSYSAPSRSVKTQIAPISQPVKHHKFSISAASERTADGLTFDSKLEKSCYQLLRQHTIKFDLHPVYELQERFEFNGKKFREISYEGDFLLHGESEDFLIDAKGMVLPVFKIKEKLLIHKYKIQLYRIKSVAALSRFLAEHGLIK